MSHRQASLEYYSFDVVVAQRFSHRMHPSICRCDILLLGRRFVDFVVSHRKTLSLISHCNIMVLSPIHPSVCHCDTTESGRSHTANIMFHQRSLDTHCHHNISFFLPTSLLSCICCYSLPSSGRPLLESLSHTEILYHFQVAKTREHLH